MGSTQATVKVADIRDNPVALRAVNKQSEDYLGIVDSIKLKGFTLSVITVREKEDPESKVKFYEIIDGLHRVTAAKDLGLEEVPAMILTLDDAETLEAQVLANIHHVETKPAEYALQMRRMFAANSALTLQDMATKLGKSYQWVNDRLSLTKISNPEIVKLINEGKIVLSNAYAMAKIPDEAERLNWIDRAMTTAPDVFIPAVTARVKEIKEDKRQGKGPSEEKFTPVAHMQKAAEVKTEMEKGENGTRLCTAEGLKKDALLGFALAIKWVLHMDTASVATQQADFEARAQKSAEDKTRKAAERAELKLEKKQKEAEEAAALAKKAHEEMEKAAKAKK